MRKRDGKASSRSIHVPYFFSDAFDLSYNFGAIATGCDQVVIAQLV